MLARFRANGGYEQWCQWVEWPMVGLSVVFLCVLILPLSANLTTSQTTTLRVLDLTIWGIFAVEYMVRLYLVEARVQWVKTHVLDLLVVAVPFLRPFRLLRVVAILMSSSRRAGAHVVRQVLIYVAITSAIVMSVCAVIVYHEEHAARGSNIHSLGDAFWWAFTTVSTVGTDSQYPVTTAGRITAIVLVFTGLALVGCITAAVAAAFVNAVRGKPDHEQAATTHANQEELSQKVDVLSETVTKLHEEVIALRRHLRESGTNRSTAHVSVAEETS
jgi:voltage-gated potassium channel